MAEIKDPENTILLELKDGTVTIELMPDIAPGHCERMKELARSGAYDNVAFHRVIEGFMAQTGDVAHGNMEEDINLGRAARMDLLEETREDLRNNLMGEESTCEYRALVERRLVACAQIVPGMRVDNTRLLHSPVL